MKRIAEWLPADTAALVFTTANRQYLTGFSSSLGYLVITKDESRLFVDGRYIIAAKQNVEVCEVELFYSKLQNVKEFIAKHNVKTLLLEDSISISCFKTFEEIFSDVDVIADKRLNDKITELRAIKTDYEIDCILKAQGIAEKAFNDVLEFIRVGVSECDIAAELEYRMKKYGSQKPAFNTIVVTGEKSALPHGEPGGNLVKDGDFVTMDFGATYNGYRSDMTRTVAVGHITDKMGTVYNTVLEAQKAAERAVKSGVLSSLVDKAARDIIDKAGYGDYFTHSTGHGIGLDVHEAPTVSRLSQAILKSGMIISDEPGIYIENEFGVRIEDMLLVSEDGAVNLTKCEKTLIIL